MDEDHSVIAAMRVITISREYGSGGGEIAARLARRLGWQLIDHEVVVRVAEKLHVSEEEAEEHDECVEHLASRIFKSLRLGHPRPGERRRSDCPRAGAQSSTALNTDPGTGASGGIASLSWSARRFPPSIAVTFNERP